MSKLLDILLKYNKITEGQYKVADAKDKVKQTAKDKYKKDKAKLSKAELQEILDKLVE
jgi:hypothetical protein